jgi:hypothetical protein
VKVLLTLVLEGVVVTASFVAAPTEIVKLALADVGNAPDDAVNVYVPTLSIAQPAKVAVPATAATDAEVHVRVAPAAFVRTIETVAVLVVASPFAPWRATRGWVANTAAPVELDGLLRNVSLVGMIAGFMTHELFDEAVWAVKAAVAGGAMTVNRSKLAIAMIDTSTVPANNRAFAAEVGFASPLVCFGGPRGEIETAMTASATIVIASQIPRGTSEW